MMTMVKRTFRVAFAATVLMAAGTASAEAVGPGTVTGPDTGEVRVVNNFLSPVRVYAEDAEGRIHPLGRVARGQLKAFVIPAEIAGLGDFRVRVYPNEPIGPWSVEEHGIKTQPLSLAEVGSVTIWVETDLAASIVEVGNG